MPRSAGEAFSRFLSWEAAGKVKLDFSGPEPRPVFGTFRGKGTYVFDDGAGPMAGTTCRSSFQSKLVEDFTMDPPFVFYGNQVAHCDNGSKIHGRIFGPTGIGTGEPRALSQTVTGTLKN